MNQSVEERIGYLLEYIWGALDMNGIPEILSTVMMNELATGGTPEQNLRSVEAVDEYLMETEGKITAGEFKDLFLELLNQR